MQVKNVWQMETKTNIKKFYEALEQVFTIPPFNTVQDALGGNTQPLKEWLGENDYNDGSGWNSIPKVSISLYSKPAVTIRTITSGRFIIVTEDYASIICPAPGSIGAAEEILENLDPDCEVRVEGNFCEQAEEGDIRYRDYFCEG